MNIFTKSEFLEDVEGYIEQMMNGAIFIYPTDTIYGLGCDARKNSSVQRVRSIKSSYGSMFSVIAPSKDWIRKNLKVKPEHEAWLKKLPGPYTLIFEIKDPECVAPAVNPVNKTLGVRIPDNWFSKVVAQAGFPIITTSLNVHGQAPITSIKEVPMNMQHMVDFGIDDGVIKGKPSTIVDLTNKSPKVTERK
jgi:tRNA threonylcarbamoyl adenosine modification protein (Sua5/YciO/YrdC/YwlC family)